MPPVSSLSAAAFRPPLALYAKGGALLDQQMWCWGCDIRRAEGNLLIAYGGLKRPAPQSHLRSAYTFTLDNAALTLWGWGVWLAVPLCGSLFISRTRFRISTISRVELQPAAWCEKDLPYGPPIASSDAWSLLEMALDWIGTYEYWVSQQVGPTYREAALTTWPQRRRYRGGCPAGEMAQQWRELQRLCQQKECL